LQSGHFLSFSLSAEQGDHHDLAVEDHDGVQRIQRGTIEIARSLIADPPPRFGVALALGSASP
jgi:hypothetical protein